jgi:homoserine/homoserine lactone efflux protein
MNETLFTGFMIATLLILSTPGPSCALAASQALRFGPRAVVITVAGDALGSLVHITIAAVGLKMIVSYSSIVLPWLQILGSFYILYLAYISYFENYTAVSKADLNGHEGFQAFLSGFVACITNPKAIVFFMAFFPGFIDPNLNILLQSIIYGTIFIVLDVLSIFFYAFLAYKLVKSSAIANKKYNLISAVGLGLISLYMLYRGVSELM